MATVGFIHRIFAGSFAVLADAAQLNRHSIAAECVSICMQESI
jgi:hypothetical protein